MKNNKEIPRGVLSYNTVVTDIQKKQNGKHTLNKEENNLISVSRQ